MTRSNKDSERRTLHVGQFIDSMDPGGAEEVVLNLARELPRHGMRVTVFHFGNRWLAEKIESAGLESVIVSARYYKSLITLPIFLWQFRRTLIEHSVELLHCHLLGAIFAGSLAARTAGISSIGTIHDVYSLADSRMNAHYLRWAQYARCSLVAVSEAMREEVTSFCRLDRINLIYNGIDIDRHAIRRDGSETYDVARLIAVARAVPIKRLDVLLDAVALLGPDWRFELVIVGDGPLLRDMERYASELGLARSVRFLGHRDDVPRLLAESDIYLQVSDSEGLSISILESMAAGLPAIVTDVGGNKELVSDGATGFVVAPGDVQAVSRRLADLIGDSGQRRELGRAAQVKARQSFAIGPMCERYAALFHELSGSDA